MTGLKIIIRNESIGIELDSPKLEELNLQLCTIKDFFNKLAKAYSEAEAGKSPLTLNF